MKNWRQRAQKQPAVASSCDEGGAGIIMQPPGFALARESGSRSARGLHDGPPLAVYRSCASFGAEKLMGGGKLALALRCLTTSCLAVGRKTFAAVIESIQG